MEMPFKRKKATLLTSSLALNDDNKVAVASAGAIPPLVSLVRDGSAAQKEHAATALWILSIDNANKVAIQLACGIQPLMKLAETGNDDQQVKAMRALSYLSLVNASKVKIAKAGDIPLLVRLVCYGNDEMQELAAAILWNLSANIHIQKAIVDASAVPVLIWLLNTGNNAQKEKATGVLSNMLTNRVHKRVVEAMGGLSGWEGGRACIASLMGRLERVPRSKRRGIVCVLAKLTELDECREALLLVGVKPMQAVTPFVQYSTFAGGKLQEYAIMVLRNLALSADGRLAIKQARGIRMLVELTGGWIHEPSSVQREAVAAVRNLSISTDIAAIIVSVGGVPPLVKLMQNGSVRQKEIALGH